MVSPEETPIILTSPAIDVVNDRGARAVTLPLCA